MPLFCSGVTNGHALFRVKIKTDDLHGFAKLPGDDNRNSVNFQAEVFLIVKIFVYGNSKKDFSTSSTANGDISNPDKGVVIV